MKKNLFTDEKQDQDQVEPENKNLPVPQVINIAEYAASMGVELPENNFVESKGELIPEILKVTILHQAQQFKWPDESKSEELTGLWVGYVMAKVYWEADRENLTEATPPTCFSFAGVRPDAANPISEMCHNCKLNMPGSDPKSQTKMGRLCKTKPRIVVYIPGWVYPVLLSLSPTAIKPMRSYLTELDSKKQRYWGVITRITLKEIKKPPYVYSVPEFEAIDLVEHLKGDVNAVNALLEDFIKFKAQFDMYSKTQITPDEEDVRNVESPDGEPF